MVSEKAVEVALDVVLGEGVIDCSTDTMRRIMRAALSAALPVMLGEAVAWLVEIGPEHKTKFAVFYQHDSDAHTALGARVTPLYTIPTPESAP